MRPYVKAPHQKRRQTPLFIRSGLMVLAASFFALVVSSVKAEKLRQDIYPGIGGVPLSFIYEGQLYEPPLQLSGTNADSIDRSTPERLLECFYTALKARNVAVLTNLYAENECHVMFSFEPDVQIRGLVLKEKIQYGQYTIVVAELTTDGRVERGTLAMKKVGTNYFFTDVLSQDRTYQFFKAFQSQSDFVRRTSVYRPRSDKPLIQMIFYPFTNAAGGPPIVVEYRGRNYGPGNMLEYRSITRTNFDLRTPEGAIRAVYAAALANDVEWYISLINPNELDMPIHPVSGSAKKLRQFVTNNLSRASEMLRLSSTVSLSRVVYYGEYAITISQRAGQEQDCLAFKRVNGRWLVTDELRRENLVWAFLTDRPHPNVVYFLPKVLPR